MKSTGVVVAALACAIGLAGTGWGQPMGPTTITPKRFIADAPNGIKVYPGSGLNPTFSRNLATVNPDGSGVAANAMRFDEPVHIAAIPAQPTEVLGGAGQILASGVDHDGSTPLLIYLDATGHSLTVFQGTSSTRSAAANSAGAW